MDNYELGRDYGQEIIGTCKSADHELMDDTRFCMGIDAVAFCCELCGWWCEISECNNDTGVEMCDECKGEDDED